MNQETKICQNCKKDFEISPDDFSFYEKIKVPPPSFCPECRLQRRMAWRNERSLYKRKCDLCQKNIIAMYNEDAPFPVYCRECWFGDGWDATSYAQEYNPNETFFKQYEELQNKVPRFALWHRNVINSDYSNMVVESKNVYLSISVAVGSENVFYSKAIDKSSDILDCINVKESTGLFECIDGEKNYNSQHLLLSKSCIDSYFLVDCVNCSNCFFSYNLRNKEFYIYNQKYEKDDYFKELEELKLKSRGSRQNLLKQFEILKKKTIYRFANITKSVDSDGNNLLNVKNCKNCFDVYDAENLKNCYRVFSSYKDSMDTDLGIKSELMYEYITGSLNDYQVKFSCSAMDSVRNADYTDSCRSCNNIFGCISLYKKDNVILNKVYSKEEFEKLRAQIIADMEKNPYIDKAGRVYKYGEFFPIELSPWAYNETVAQEIYPITKEEAEKNGYKWKDQEKKNFDITIPADKIPDNIDEVDESILKEVLGCAHKGECADQCNTAFRLTDYEFKFYKKHSIPLPVLCPNCRYYERFKVMPALKLWERNCMKPGCANKFETSYAPDRPETVYCERCYQQEVY